MIANNKYSNYKIAWFPKKLESLRTSEVTAPIYVRIKPTNRCNHSCFFCVYNSEFSNMHDTMRKIDQISKEKMFEILDDLKDIGTKAITFSGGGEPLVHKDINSIVSKTLDLGLDLSMLTNGELLKGEIAKIMLKAKWIRISMDYCTAEMFYKSRKGNEERFLNILENIKIFNKMIKNTSSSCELGINFIITKDNYNIIEKAADLLVDLNVNNIRFSPVWIPEFYEYHIPLEVQVKEQLDRIKKKYNTETNTIIYDSYMITKSVNKRQYTQCYFMQITPVIGADCNVYNCHNKAYDKDGTIGSIKNQKFSDLWFSEETSKYFRSFQPHIKCSHQCANDKKNIFIHEIINSYGDHYV